VIAGYRSLSDAMPCYYILWLLSVRRCTVSLTDAETYSFRARLGAVSVVDHVTAVNSKLPFTGFVALISSQFTKGTGSYQNSTYSLFEDF
jgi:hypothetical protein